MSSQGGGMGGGMQGYGLGGNGGGMGSYGGRGMNRGFQGFGQPKTGGEYTVNAPTPTGGANYQPGPVDGMAPPPGLGQPMQFGQPRGRTAYQPFSGFGPQGVPGMNQNGGFSNDSFMKGLQASGVGQQPRYIDDPYRDFSPPQPTERTQYATNLPQLPGAPTPEPYSPPRGAQATQAPPPNGQMGLKAYDQLGRTNEFDGMMTDPQTGLKSWFGQNVQMGRPGAGWEQAQQVYGRANGVGKYGDQFGTVKENDPFWQGVSPEFRPGGAFYGRR